MTSEQLIRIEMARGNIYKDAVTRFIKYLNGIGEVGLASQLVATVKEADEKYRRIRDDISDYKLS